jgi:hypothetical protein
MDAETASLLARQAELTARALELVQKQIAAIERLVDAHHSAIAELAREAGVDVEAAEQMANETRREIEYLRALFAKPTEGQEGPQ